MIRSSPACRPFWMAEIGNHLTCLAKLPLVSSDLWLGAAMTLAGAAIAGAISVILSHQQMKYT